MKLTKKLLLLQFSVMLIFIFSACNYESGVMKTLPKYSVCEKYSYGARDFVDYHKYYCIQSFNRFLIISLDVLICRYSPLLRAFPALFISEEPHKSFYYPSCFHSQK